MFTRSLVEGEFLKLSTSVVSQQEISPSSGPSVTQSRVLNLADGQSTSSVRVQANVRKNLLPLKEGQVPLMHVSLFKKKTASLQIHSLPCGKSRGKV